MFHLIQCKPGGLVHEVLDYDEVIVRFMNTHAEAAINGWITTSRSGDILELAKTILIICIE